MSRAEKPAALFIPLLAALVCPSFRLTSSSPLYRSRLIENYPYLTCEVRYAAREYARTAIDVLARRTRLAFLDNKASRAALKDVVDILGEELNWDSERKARETQDAAAFLDTMQAPSASDAVDAATHADAHPVPAALHIKTS